MIHAGFENSRSVSLKTAFRQHAGAWPEGVRYFAHKRPVPPPRPREIIDARQAVRIAERFCAEWLHRLHPGEHPPPGTGEA